MAPWAIGTDTGGSVRIPAAWNGITGLKTTIGRVSTHGVLPLSHTLDTPGPITRDIEDAALLLSVLQGADPRDPHTLSVRDVDPMPELRRGVTGLRLGRLPAAERDGVDAEVLAAYDRSVDFLASLGAEIVEVTLPERFGALGGVVGPDHFGGDLCRDRRSRRRQRGTAGSGRAARVRAGAAISAKDYLRGLAERERMNWTSMQRSRAWTRC